MKTLNITSIFLSLFIFCSSTQTQGQSPTIKIGNVAKLDNDVTIEKVCTGNYKGTYLIYGVSEGFSYKYSVAYFDENLNLVKKSDIPHKYGKPEKKSRNFVYFNDKIHFIYEEFNKKENKTTVTARAMNMKTLALNTEVIQLGSNPSKRAMYSKTDNGLSITFGWKANDYKTSKKYEYKTLNYNDKLELISPNKEKKDIGEAKAQSLQAISNYTKRLYDSKIIASTKIKTSSGFIYTTNIGKYKGMKLYGKSSVSINKEGHATILIDVNTKGFPIWELSLKEVNGQIKGYAYFTNEKEASTNITQNKTNKISGIYTFEIDPTTQKLTKENYALIPNKETKFARDSYSLSPFMINDKGEGYAIIEIESQREVYETTIYSYGSLHIIKLDSEGNIKKTQLLKKDQTFPDPNEASYITMINGSNLHIILNDSPKNLSNESNSKVRLANDKNSEIYIYTLDKDLNIKRRLFDTSNKTSGRLSPYLSESFKENKLKGFIKVKKSELQLFEIYSN